MSQNDAAAECEPHDEHVIQAALRGHLEYVRTAEAAHRTAARALPAHPEVVVPPTSPITLAAAHRARSSSFAQRGEFIQQLINFPTSGLRGLSAQDMRTLQVPAHIGAAAIRHQLAQQMTERENRTRLSAARPRPDATTASLPVVSPAVPGTTGDLHPVEVPAQAAAHPDALSFDDVLYGTDAGSFVPADQEPEGPAGSAQPAEPAQSGSPRAQ